MDTSHLVATCCEKICNEKLCEEEGITTVQYTSEKNCEEEDQHLRVKTISLIPSSTSNNSEEEEDQHLRYRKET